MAYDYSRKALYRPETKPVFVGVDHMPPFDDQATAPSLINAWWLANFSHLAYYEEKDVAKTLDQVGFWLAAFFTGKSTQGFLAVNDHVAILSFRGTEPDRLEDLITDLRFRLDEFTEGTRAHKGFRKALDEVWGGVTDSLDALEGRGVRVWYTGHSLGAALATLSAARRKPDALVIFASPRVGDEPFTALLKEVPLHRFVNCTDLAAAVPPGVLGYRHVGPTSFLTAHGKLLENPGRWTVWRHKVIARLSYAAHFPWFRRGVVVARSFTDHAILNYIEGIRRALKRAGI